MGFNAGQIARTIGRVNVREGPGLSWQIVTTLAPMAEIKLELSSPGDGLTWWKFKRGWVAEVAPDGTRLLEDATPLGDFQKAMRFVSGWEGGLSMDPQDPGNWTGGRPGVGELRGTKRGISALAHPTLDIPNLTDEQIDKLYFDEYWIRCGCDRLAYPIALMNFDTAVNMGPGVADKLLGLSAGNAVNYGARRLVIYTTYANFGRYGSAWIRRVADLLETISDGIQM